MALKRKSRGKTGIDEIDNLPLPPRRFTVADWADMDDGKIPICGAKTKWSGQPCKWPAGFGTDHFGVGRCMYHDYRPERQSAPLLYYLDPELRNAVSTYVNTDELLNLRTELAVLRIRFAEINNIDFDSLSSEDRRDSLRQLMSLSREISRLAEAIMSMEQGMHKYIHISVTGSILSAIADITKEYIPPSQVEAFMADLERAVKEGMNRLTAKEIAVGALLPDVTYFSEVPPKVDSEDDDGDSGDESNESNT